MSLKTYREWKATNEAMGEENPEFNVARTTSQGRAIQRSSPLYQALGANLAQAFEAIAADNRQKARMLLTKIAQALASTEEYQHSPIIAQLKMRTMAQINQLVKSMAQQQPDEVNPGTPPVR